MITRRTLSPHFTNLLQFAITLLVILYMLFIGGSFDATVRFRTQLLNAVGASVIAILWFIIRWRSGEKLKATGLEIPLAIFVVAQTISTLASPQVRLSADGLFATISWAILFIIFCDLLANSWRKDHVINSLLLVAAIIIFDGLWQTASWYLQWIQIGQAPPTTFRLDGFLGHANLTTITINLLLPLIIAQIIQRPHPLARIAFGALALGALVVEFFASSRAGWIAGAVALSMTGILLAWTYRERVLTLIELWKRSALLYRIIHTAIFIGVAASVIPLLIRQTQHGTHSPDIIASRQAFWESAWKLFLIQPLTGLGPETFAWFYPLTVSMPPSGALPHAHSAIFQLLAAGGVIGVLSGIILIAVGGQQLWQRWRTTENKVMVVALIGGISGVVTHHLFDYFFSAPLFTFLFAIICALAFRPSTQIAKKWIALPILITLAFTAFSLIGTSLNSQGVELAVQGEWQEAAQLFRRATEIDPGLPLYWEHAAQAQARSGSTITFAQRAVKENPHSSIDRAALGVLTRDVSQLREAVRLAPQSKLIQINLGWLAEDQGDAATAQEAYTRALTHGTTPKALFWNETTLRSSTLTAWKAKQPINESTRDRAWSALSANDLSRALTLFEQARLENPSSNDPYIGLSRSYIALGDIARAKNYLRLGFSLYASTLEEQLELYNLQGDIAKLEGDRAKHRCLQRLQRLHQCRSRQLWFSLAGVDHVSP
jgi:tetratricopeptide (TPR) repeat protein